MRLHGQRTREGNCWSRDVFGLRNPPIVFVGESCTFIFIAVLRSLTVVACGRASGVHRWLPLTWIAAGSIRPIPQHPGSVTTKHPQLHWSQIISWITVLAAMPWRSL
jgi:hypothetical protein